MQVHPFDVVMQVDDIRLFVITHFLHVPLCDAVEFGVTQHVFGRRVQRYVENRFFRIPVCVQVRFERAHARFNVYLCGIFRYDHVVAENHTAFAVVHFDFVVGQYAVKGLTRCYFRYHRR